MRLLLDLGNTRLKWAMQREGFPLESAAVAWAEDPVAALSTAWRGLPKPSAVVAASVVDDTREALVGELVRNMFGGDPVWLRTPAAACGVRNAYAEPQRLGVDRFLGMVAAYADARAPCVLVGVGTALTLDALAMDGTHLGGLIAPGPRLMQQSLLGATARVRPEHAGSRQELADNTADAVVSGCWGACAGLVERFVRQMTARLGAAPAVLLGGGDAEALLPMLELPATIVIDAVLHGLGLWADAHLPDFTDDIRAAGASADGEADD
jgi:type III pantothenate kinase